MLKSKLQSRLDVISALVLRDMRTRFGRSHLGYLVAVLWPLAHLTSIVVLAAFINRVLPMGTDPAVFVATGALPYILCLYPARLIAISVTLSKPLFLFPVVRVFDVIVSRIIIEFVTAFIVVIIFSGSLLAAGVDLIPLDYSTVAGAIICTIYLSISLGYLSTVIISIFPFWHIGFVVLMVLLYATAGVFIVPSTLPQHVRDMMWFNPLVHCVEWMRSAYYEGYGDDMLSRGYLVWFSNSCLLLGLLGERFMRGKLLSS
ncbi:ABC transporter permease [Ensifer sp. 2YAB10]|uniref:ABC transporter permease n=1 Tax=unclassified Ensifer TaxID=2633371 RepID=UPI003F90D01D